MQWFCPVIFTAIYMVLTMTIHELAHVVSAKLLDKRVKKIGFSIRPFPHFFVSVNGELRGHEKRIFLLSGVGTIAVLAIILAPLYTYSNALRTAILLQLVIDTNPFYSDVALVVYDWTTAKEREPSSLASLAPKYHYMGAWYVHLVAWITFVVQTIKIIQR